MYYFVYGFLYLISLLPLRLLFILSDGLYLLAYYVIGYRKKVVMSNLQIAFPEKSETERIKIAKQFYKNFIDSFIETIKLISASNQYLSKRFKISGLDLLNELQKTGKSCQLHLGHTFNWEWGQLVLQKLTPYKLMVVYMPISNKTLDKIFYKIRTRNHSIFIPATSMKSSMAHYCNMQYLLALVADQSPSNPAASYWLQFFNRPTPFVKGPERGARMNNLPVFFAHIEKPRRGYYHAVLEQVVYNVAELKEGELTLKYTRYLERVIEQNSSMWLWSHKRWKHKWEKKYESNWIDNEVPPKDL